MRSDKTILVDADGVLFDWEYSFDQWMNRHGYHEKDPGNYRVVDRYQLEYTEAKKLTRMFNESAWIRRLPPMRDAVKYVRKLHEEHGYVFHVISSLSDDTYSQYLRTRNLIELFGPTVFEKYTYLDTGADKDDALEPYRDSDCWWIEDKPANAALGADLGLKALLMQHHHNMGWNARQYNVTRVMNWREVYEMIIGEGQR